MLCLWPGDDTYKESRMQTHTYMQTHTNTHIHTFTQNSQLVTCCRWSGESLFVQSCSTSVEVERERGMRDPKLESEWRRCWITWTSSGSSCFLRLSVCLSDCHFVRLFNTDVIFFLLRNFSCVCLWQTDRKQSTVHMHFCFWRYKQRKCVFKGKTEPLK